MRDLNDLNHKFYNIAKSTIDEAQLKIHISTKDTYSTIKNIELATNGEHQDKKVHVLKK
jgi:hypothetical protein